MPNLNKRIYIIGPVGSGKTTLAKKLSQKYKIKYYELDSVIWNDSVRIKRNPEEINKIFSEIISNDSYIIEDVGRDIFKNGIINSDIVYYIKISKIRSYFRILKRWIRQRLKLEKCNYQPTLKILFNMIKWLHKDLKKQNKKIENIEKLNSNLVILKYGDIKRLI